MQVHSQQSTGLFEQIQKLKSEVSCAIKSRACEIISLATAIEAVDIATQRYMAIRSADSHQALLTAARNLSSRLDSGVNG